MSCKKSTFPVPVETIVANKKRYPESPTRACSGQCRTCPNNPKYHDKLSR